ncbi:signal peptide peptidase SppA [bacterium]|nr:signal peptide peptidase SppA [bacterium]
MKSIFRFFRNIFTVIGVLTVLTVVSLVMLIVSISDKISKSGGFKEEVFENTLLTINTSAISGDVFAQTDYMVLNSYFTKQISLIDTLSTIQNAANDPKILGIFINMNSLKLNYAQTEELRKGLAEFKKSGKPVYVWSDSYGEIASGTKSYFLASVADKIYIQEAGAIAFNGLESTSAFFKNTLEKLKIEMIGGKRKEYKTYWNTYTEEKFTDAHRESAESLLNSLFSKIAAEVSESRKIPINEVYRIANQPPLSSKQALDANFVDGIKYLDEAVTEMKTATKFTRKMSLIRYNKSSVDFIDIAGLSTVPAPPQIAVIEIPGGIHRGESDISPSGNPESSGSATIVSLLKKAWRDDNIKGIILRVNSPGGSVVASETIWNQIGAMRRENRKPIIVSMGGVAASGGYYVSMGAEKIFADHCTITGSIGVVMGKTYTREFFNMLGVTFDTASTADTPNIFSALDRLTPEQTEYFEKMMDETYDSFVSRAAQGRGIEKSELEKYAKGRVWSGEMAKKHGLIDEIGGFTDAFDFMKKRLGTAEAKLVKYPRESDFLTLIFRDDEDETLAASRFGKLSSMLNRLVRIISVMDREINSDGELYRLEENIEID